MRIIAAEYYSDHDKNKHPPYILVGEILNNRYGRFIKVYQGGYSHSVACNYRASWLSSAGTSTSPDYTVLVDDPHCKSLKHFISTYPHLFI